MKEWKLNFTGKTIIEENIINISTNSMNKINQLTNNLNKENIKELISLMFAEAERNFISDDDNMIVIMDKENKKYKEIHTECNSEGILLKYV